MTFFEGSLGVIVRDIEFDIELTEAQIEAILAAAAADGTLLPGFTVIMETLYLGLPDNGTLASEAVLENILEHERVKR